MGRERRRRAGTSEKLGLGMVVLRRLTAFDTSFACGAHGIRWDCTVRYADYFYYYHYYYHYQSVVSDTITSS
jgi:hypothetical protein